MLLLKTIDGRLSDETVQQSCGPSIGEERQEPRGFLAREEVESVREERFGDFLSEDTTWTTEPGVNRGERNSNLFNLLSQRENLERVPVPDGAVPSITCETQEVLERTVSPS